MGARIALLQMDRFYLTLPHGKNAAEHNFDEPAAFDWPLFIETLKKLSTGEAVQVPKYDFNTHSRLADTDRFEHADVIIVEGILTLYDQQVQSGSRENTRQRRETRGGERGDERREQWQCSVRV